VSGLSAVLCLAAEQRLPFPVGQLKFIMLGPVHSTTAEILAGSRQIGAGPDYIAMLWAYLDDSSDSKRERFCAAGGFFSVDLRWQKFELAWRATTHKLKEPFRSTECECGHGQFADWPKMKRDALMAELCYLIKTYDLGAFGAAVSVSDYRAVFPDAEEHDPYLLCLGLCFANMAEITEISNRLVKQFDIPLGPTGVRFWVEENRDTAAKATQIYHDIKAVASWPPASRMEEIAHLGKSIVGLQAADLIAREVFKFYDNAGVRPVRKPVLALSQHVTFFCWETEHLTRFAELKAATSYAAAIVAFARSLSLTNTGNPIVPGIFMPS
jgi:hypothetical protein